MKNLFKAMIISVATLTMTACASSPENIISYKKVGKVDRVELMLKESKPSFVEVLAGATVGGLLGNQIGGGSAKYWTTSIGALAGAKAVDVALSEKYKEIHYRITFLDGTRETLTSKDLAPTVFKRDLVVVERYGDKFKIDAYGQYNQYSREQIKQFEKDVAEGKF